MVVIVAGEASADLHGSNLVNAIKRYRPDALFCGIGGGEMERAGVKILVPSSDMAVVGVTEVLYRLRTIAKAAKKLKSVLKGDRPDLLILIDYPEFNIYMAKFAKRLNVPVLYYISPQVWAWRRGRVKKIARRIDRMAVILPFEEAFYQVRGVKVEYVGHPLMDMEIIDRPPLSLVDGDPVIGLVPGSRKEEIRNLLPIMIKSVEILKTKYPEVRSVLPLAGTIDPGFVDSFIRETSIDVDVRHGDICKVLNDCHVALVTSGTATLDAAIMAVPMVVVYKVSSFSYQLAKMMIKVPHIGLVNLIAGEKVVPELIQTEVTPEALAEEALTLLYNREIREETIKRLHNVRESLGQGGASDRTAKMALKMMKNRELS